MSLVVLQFFFFWFSIAMNVVEENELLKQQLADRSQQMEIMNERLEQVEDD